MNERALEEAAEQQMLQTVSDSMETFLGPALAVKFVNFTAWLFGFVLCFFFVFSFAHFILLVV